MPKQSNSCVKGFAVPSQEPPSQLLMPCSAPLFHLLMLAVWYSHSSLSAWAWVPGSQLVPCLSSHKHCTLTRPFPYSLQQGIHLRCAGQTSDTETGLVKKTKQKPSLSLAYLIWFIKQASESEVLPSSTHVHHCFLQRTKHSCPNMLTGSMASSTIKCCQLWSLSHTGDSPNPAGTQLQAELCACCSPVPEGFCRGFLSSHVLSHNTSPAAPPTGLLDLWHTTNCSKLSFPQCIPSVRQCFNRAILCKTNVF